MKLGDKVIVRGCSDDASRVGDVGTIKAIEGGRVLVAFSSKSKMGYGWGHTDGTPYCWYLDHDGVEVVSPRPDFPMRDVNGVDIAEGDKIVYVTLRGSHMKMIPAVVVKATGANITVRRINVSSWQDPDRKIVLTRPEYIAITESAYA